MAYPSLADREQAARDATAHARMQERQRDAAEEAEQGRADARKGFYAQFDTVLRLATDALARAYRRDEIGKRIERYTAKNEALDDGDLVRTVLKYLISFPYVSLVVVIDFLFLSAAASFFLSLAGITNLGAVLVGKLVLPVCFVFFEIASAVHAYRHGGKPPKVAYLLPCVIAVLAGVTFLAFEGVTSMADVTFFTIVLLFVVLALGFIIHYFVVVLAPRVVEGFAYLFLVVLRRVYHKLVVAAEQATAKVYTAFLGYLRGVEDYNRRFDEDEAPRFDLLPEPVRALINQHAGAEVIPPVPPPVPHGDGAAPPSLSPSPDGVRVERDGRDS